MHGVTVGLCGVTDAWVYRGMCGVTEGHVG